MKRLLTSIALCFCLAMPIFVHPIAAQEDDIDKQNDVPQEQVENNDHLEDYSKKYGYDEISETKRVHSLQSRARSAALPNAYVAVFIEFPDLQSITFSNAETTSVVNMIMNDGGKLIATGNVEKNIVSLRNYLSKYSYNTMNLQTYMYPKDNGIIKSYVAPQPIGYYKKKSAVNSIGYSTDTEQMTRERELVGGALAAVSSEVEASVSAQQLDSGNDGYIDAISFFVESDPYGNDIGWGDLLWSHKTNGYFSTKIAGKSVDAYNLIDAKNPTLPGGVFSYTKEPISNDVYANRANYGVIQHEFLHTLGLPDLYRGYDAGVPVGFYDVMAQQIPDNPQAPTSLMRRDWLKWGSPIESIARAGSVTLTIPTYTNPNEKNAIKIKSPLNAKEYFIVDYYKRQENQIGYVGRDDGLIIYRVNENTQSGNINANASGVDDYMFVFRPNETTRQQAKGNLIDAVIPTKVGNTYGKTLSDTTNSSWDRDTLYYSDGTNSGVKLNISAVTSTSVTFDVSLPSIGGTGTAQDPYLIYNAQDFNLLKTYQGKYFKLMNDIDFGGSDFTPIDQLVNHLDGQNFTIKNVKISQDGGFFSMIDFGASVKNLKFENVNVDYSGDNHVGILAATANGTVDNVHVLSGSVKGSTANANMYRGAGGLVGTATSGAIIKNSSSSANVVSGKYVGGLIGLNQGSVIETSYANGLVGIGSIATGGLIGGELNFSSDPLPTVINCAFDMGKTNQAFAQNGKNLTGVIGYRVDDKVSYFIEDSTSIQLAIATQPTQTFTKKVSIQNPNLLFFSESKNTFSLLNVGTTKVIQSISLGSNAMPLETTVEIKSRATTLPITSITLNESNLTLDVGAQYRLQANIAPSNTTEKVTWSSSNSSVASVDQNGNVKALKVGTATIYAQSPSGIRASCFVTVKTPIIPISSIALNTTSRNMFLNSQFSLKATLSPSNTTEKITWSSSNGGVASVDQSGNVKALKAGTATIYAKSPSGKQATCSVKVYRQPNVNYRTHIQSVGWQGYQKNGQMAGTSGRSLRLEGININLSDNDFGGGVEYSTHIQNIGWQSIKRDNALSGTSGRSLRLEGIKIRLYGNIANEYDIYYRVHAQNVGWLDWAKNGEVAGSAGLAYRLEGIEIRLVKKGGAAPGKTTRPYVSAKVNYQTHVQTIGWQSNKTNGQTAGTTARSLRLEGIKISKVDDIAGDVQYRTHVQNIGWQGFVKNGQMSGTSGRSLRLEAIEIKLTGELANAYDVYYRVHSQHFGWLGWAKNGAPSGSAGYGYRLEAIQIMFVEKGGAAPGSSANAFRQK